MPCYVNHKILRISVIYLKPSIHTLILCSENCTKRLWLTYRHIVLKQRLLPMKQIKEVFKILYS